MSEMRARLIRAAICSLYPGGASESMAENGQIIVPPHIYSEASGLITALLTEMREPTNGMLEHGSMKATETKLKDIPTIWRDMIDEALK